MQPSKEYSHPHKYEVNARLQNVPSSFPQKLREKIMAHDGFTSSSISPPASALPGARDAQSPSERSAHYLGETQPHSRSGLLWNRHTGQTDGQMDESNQMDSTNPDSDSIRSAVESSGEGSNAMDIAVKSGRGSEALENDEFKRTQMIKAKKNMTDAIKALRNLMSPSERDEYGSSNMSSPSTNSRASVGSSGMRDAQTAKLDAMLTMFRISPPAPSPRELQLTSSLESDAAEDLSNEQEQTEDRVQQFLKLRASTKRDDFNRIIPSDYAQEHEGDEAEEDYKDPLISSRHRIAEATRYRELASSSSYVFNMHKVKQIARELIRRVMLPDTMRRKIENFKTVPSLNQKQDKEVATALCTQSPVNKIYFTSNLAEVTGYRLRSLRPTVWLDDEIVNGCMSLLLQRARTEEPMRSLNWTLRNATPNDTTLCQRLLARPSPVKQGTYGYAQAQIRSEGQIQPALSLNSNVKVQDKAVGMSTNSNSSSISSSSGLLTAKEGLPTLMVEASSRQVSRSDAWMSISQFNQSNRSIRSITFGRVHIFSSQFFQLFLSNTTASTGGSAYGGYPHSSAVSSSASSPKYDYSLVRRWSQTQNVNILFLDKLIVPCHVSGNHWTLVVANLRYHQFEYYDSLRGRSTFFLQCIRQYIIDEAMQHYGVQLDISSWPDVYMEDIPQQMNHCDCGVFSIMFADAVSENRASKRADFGFEQRDMDHLRLRLTLDLVKGRIP